MKLYPQWIEPARTIRGQDHLGLQAISIAFYNTLLPGITNQTHRARYFSIYPWILANYAKRVGVFGNKDKWRDFLRRSEFLYALLSLDGEGDYTIPGAEKAADVLADAPKTIKISEYADQKVQSEKRYWQLSGGAYAQYYLGALQELDIIQFDNADSVEHLGLQGIILVDAIDKVVDPITRDLFFDAVTIGNINYKDLQKLSDVLRPSSLEPKSAEGEALRSLFLSSQIPAHSDRIDTLRLLLEVAAQASPKTDINSESLRYILLNKSYPNQKSFHGSSNTAECYDRWIVYIIAEHLHFALESLFWYLLQKIYESGPLPHKQLLRRLSDEVARVLISSKLLKVHELTKMTFLEVLEIIEKRLGDEGSDWDISMTSSKSLVATIRKSIREGDTKTVLLAALQLYAHTVVNNVGSDDVRNAFGPTTALGIRHNDLNPRILLNPREFRSHLLFDQGIQFLFLSRIVNRHLRVAMRKLRNQQQSTFKFMLQEGRLIWMDDIFPTFTSPRLNAAMNILKDLGLATWIPAKITSLGKSYITK